jgi:hypothetical protein
MICTADTSLLINEDHTIKNVARVQKIDKEIPIEGLIGISLSLEPIYTQLTVDPVFFSSYPSGNAFW